MKRVLLFVLLGSVLCVLGMLGDVRLIVLGGALALSAVGMFFVDVVFSSRKPLGFQRTTNKMLKHAKNGKVVTLSVTRNPPFSWWK